ncbi:MAG: class I SAM-dependent methyltransferase, partial [Pyrinomonadaceae bacterium]
PLQNLYTLPGIEIIAKEVQDVEPSFFERIESGDVLFIDSSHSLRLDGDVPYLYLEVLPAISKGAYIHIHDIPYPFNFPYPPKLWIFEKREPMFWTEAMVLQAFLAFNKEFQILLSLPLIRHADEPFLAERIPIYETVEQNSNAFSSVWLRREEVI